jgi:hypothetical protein
MLVGTFGRSSFHPSQLAPALHGKSRGAIDVRASWAQAGLRVGRQALRYAMCFRLKCDLPATEEASHEVAYVVDYGGPDPVAAFFASPALAQSVYAARWAFRNTGRHQSLPAW